MNSTLFDAELFRSSHAVPANQKQANDLFDQMVNGHLLTVMDKTRFTEKLAVTVSTICALMKEFDKDWALTDLSSASVADQREALRELGYYCQLPVKTLNNMLRRKVRAGLRYGSRGLGDMITKFLNLYRPSNDRMIALTSYLFTAFKSVRMSKPDFATPFQIYVSNKGRVYLEYYFRSSKTKRMHVRRYDLGCSFMENQGLANRQMRSLFLP